MPSKKRKYNARFPAGRIKKIMQTDEEVGKVAQAVPIIISRTLELFVESLLSSAMRVTMARGAKTLSPSHVKQCILAEARFDFLRDLLGHAFDDGSRRQDARSQDALFGILAEARFDFLRDLVQNIPDVTAAEEKEMMNSEDSSNTARLPDAAPPRRLAREDSNCSTSSEVRQKVPRNLPARSISLDPEIHRPRPEVTSTIVSTDTVMDLSKKPVRTANFYQETLPDEVQHHSVITLNPTYASPQPSTSNFANLTPVPIQQQREFIPKPERKFFVDVPQNNNSNSAPVTPILNIDFTKSLAKPEIKVLGPTASNIVPNEKPRIQRQNSNTREMKKVKTPVVDLDRNSGNLQIDEDYDT